MSTTKRQGTDPLGQDKVLTFHPMPFIQGRYVLVLNDDELDEVCREYEIPPKHFDVLEGWGQHVYLSHKDKGLLSVVRLDVAGMDALDKEKGSTDLPGRLAVLVHECMHVVQRWQEFVGESEPGKEFQAYFLEEVFRNLATDYLARS